ncbi:MAG: hypothetical protein K8I27_03630 [Planctomycetes bacterium]|nr:hypothetical protein [Planctomycetota bacterium]
MKILKTHARFIIVTIVLVVVLYIAHGELSDISEGLDAKRTQAKTLLSKNYRALYADAGKYNGSPATVHGRKLQDKTMVANAVTEEVNDRMGFETSPAFTLDDIAGRGTAEHVARWQERQLEVQQEFQFQRYFGPSVRDDKAFGFAPQTENLTTVQVKDYLRKLDIARGVAKCVERAGVQQLNKLDFKSVSEELFQRGVPTRASAQGEEPYFTGEGLEIRVQGDEQSLYNFLIELQSPEKEGLRRRYLAVEKFELTKPDLLNPQDNLITATITVIAYRVNPESTYPPDKDAAAKTTSTPRNPYRR